MSHGRPKGIPASKAQRKAGAKNLAKWQKEEGHGQQRRTHGAYSVTIRQRYSDLRTSEGRKLRAVIDSIVDDLGGVTEVNSAQNVILASLRSKFIVIFQISDFLDKQQSIINQEGYILPILGQNLLQYSDSIRKDLEGLYGLNRSTLRRKVPQISDIIAQSKDVK
jgi:hypothetical protein